jgi:hypothetical protein
MLYLSTPWGQATPETALWSFQEGPARRASGLWPSFTPLDTLRPTIMSLTYFFSKEMKLPKVETVEDVFVVNNNQSNR